jgi:signal transduction histidine kinase
MTLLRKFAVLFGVLGLMVVLNLGTSLWAVSVLQREISVYLSSISNVLGGLNQLKRDLADIASLIPASANEAVPWAAATRDTPLTEEEARAEFGKLTTRAREQLQTLEQSGTFRARTGISTKLNIESRVHDALGVTERWFASLGGSEKSRDAAAAAESREQLFVLHELIERNEAKILGDAQQAVLHAREVRARVVSAMIVVLGVTAAAGLLGVALVQRWVVKPVTELRTAAGRIASGDFGHRVPVQGRDELAMLSSEVNHMAGMIWTMQEERVERERLAAIGEMVRRLVHNLRNPLAGIRSLAELTKGDLRADDPAQENQDRIISTVDRFERWLAEMLSATSPLALELQETDADAWLGRLVEPLRPMAASRGVELVVKTPDSPLIGVFDPRHLEQALVGIITNAIQVSVPGQSVVVAVQRVESDLEIRVEDQGPGVPEELAEKVFRPYFTTKKNGTGIGLAVAKQVVEQHGGRITVRKGSGAVAGSCAQPGAAFVLHLPLDGGVTRIAQQVARNGQFGGTGGQDPDSRGRVEPAVLHPADAEARRA